EAEKGFKRLGHYRELPVLVDRLESRRYHASLEEYRTLLPEAFRGAAVAPLRATPSAPRQPAIPQLSFFVAVSSLLCR
ncbi:MAG: hypothetical protein U9Q79_08275, partial [Candidatus Hydrogenedentes bacterium]|nr:hypothetical protein [Candidatus Hydrogenedentota bacterium]